MVGFFVDLFDDQISTEQFFNYLENGQ